MSRPPGARVRTLVALGVLSLTALGGGCGDSTAEFCAERDRQDDLPEVVAAVVAPDRDQAEVEAAVEGLDRLVDVAPDEIRTDLRQVVQVLEDTVRLIAGAGEGGGPLPDEAEVEMALAEVIPAAERVEAFTDEHC